MRFLKRINVLINSIILRLLYPIIILMPIKKRIIFIGYKDSYKGNSKHLYEYMKLKNKVPVYFLTNSKKVYQKYDDGMFLLNKTFKCIWYLMTSSIIVADSNIDSLTNLIGFRAKTIQLWHGNGMKEIGTLEMTKKPVLRQIRLFLSYITKTIPKYDLVYFTSEYSYIMRHKAFKFKKYKFNGQPRNDILFNDKTKYSRNSNILYVPTWRERKDKYNVFETINFDTINEYCKSNSFIFNIKLHPEERQNLDKFNDFSNIKLIDKKTDVNDILNTATILITDYSSIYFDYLLLNRPIIFFPIDKEDYFNNQRGILYDYDDITPGKQVFNTKELINEIDTILIKGNDEYINDRKRIIDLFYKYQDDKSRERAANDILELMGLENEKI